MVKKQGIQCYRWCFTFNNYTKEDITSLRIRLNRTCKKYIFQEEKGEKNGTEHLQGSVSFITKARLTELKKIDKRIHWEATKNVEAADKYACKEETRNGEVYRFEKKKAFIRKKSKFDDIEPRSDIISLIEQEPDNRTINWVWSNEGGVGKTSTCAYIEHNYENVCIANGKGHDIKNSIIAHLADNELDVLIINVPRCNENYVSYSAIEEVKDGLIYSGKYEGGFANIEHPHVIVISNFYPDTAKLSEDRWNIIEIKK
ncbi:rep protein [Circoviridae sp.]|nr:rep protein [Circoviridae sp.]